MASRAKEWCFTLSNYNNDDRGHLGLSAVEFCVFFCYQPELAPTTLTPHLQGYLCLKTPRTLRGVKQSVFNTERLGRVHLEIARGTREQARDYCSKPESRDSNAGFGYCEIGDFDRVPAQRGQGARNDLGPAVSAIRDGTSLALVAEANPEAYVKFHRGFRALESALHARPRVRDEGGVFQPPRVLWYYGSTGSGKTRAVFEEIGEEPFYSKPPGNTWWDGYCGQKIVILDDFRASWFKFGYLLRLLDRYPLDVEVKGAYVPFSATTIYITCPTTPQLLYAGLESAHEGAIAQLVRRITEVRLFGEAPAPPGPLVAGFEPI